MRFFQYPVRQAQVRRASLMSLVTSAGVQNGDCCKRSYTLACICASVYCWRAAISIMRPCAIQRPGERTARWIVDDGSDDGGRLLADALKYEARSRRAARAI